LGFDAAQGAARGEKPRRLSAENGTRWRAVWASCSWELMRRSAWDEFSRLTTGAFT